MKHRILTSILALMMVFALLLTGCGQSGGSGQPADAAEPAADGGA